MKPIYTFNDYRAYIEAYIQSRPQKGWGLQAKIAKLLNCHTTFVSQVLKGNLDFSLEQTLLLTEFMDLNTTETEFFLLLVQYNRAGSAKLKNYFKKQLDVSATENNKLSKRIITARKLNDDELARYCSSWVYGATYATATLPHINTADEVAKYLNIPRYKAQDAIEYLLEVGILSRDGNILKSGVTSFHIDDNKPELMIRNLTNWRLRAIQQVQKIHPKDKSVRLHWATSINLSKKDVPILREEFFQAIQRVRKIVSTSKEEVAYAYTLDLFPLSDDPEEVPQLDATNS